MHNTNKSSRYLNERSNWFGLGVFDLASLGYLLILSFDSLSRWDLELFAFAVTGIAGLTLIQIRLAGRPKCIRDFLQFQFKRILRWI